MEQLKRIEASPQRQTEAQKSSKKIHIVSADHTLYLSVMLLVLIGVVMVFSASYYVAVTFHNASRFHFLTSQFIAAVVGFVAVGFLSNVNYRYWFRFIPLAYLIGLALLVMVLVTNFGEAAGGAQRWIDIGGFRFQPSEPAKLATILMLAKVITGKKNLLTTAFGHVTAAGYLMLPVALIAVENGSTSIVLAGIGAAMIFVASPFTKVFLLTALVGGSAGLFYLFTGEEFRMARFEAWLDPWSDPTGVGFQTVQSLYAIGTGGIFGVGLGNSRQKLGFIPEAHNDIIFSVIVEELGILGGGIILFLFGVFLWRAIKIAIHADDMFGALIATGIATMVGAQALINVGVVTNSIPNTGVPLPFISFGGTSLVTMLVSVGLLLSISRYKKDLR